MDLGFCLDLLGLRPTLIGAVVLPLTTLMVLTVLVSTATATATAVPLVPMVLVPPLIMTSLKDATTGTLGSVSATATWLALAGIRVYGASILLAAT